MHQSVFKENSIPQNVVSKIAGTKKSLRKKKLLQNIINKITFTKMSLKNKMHKNVVQNNIGQNVIKREIQFGANVFYTLFLCGHYFIQYVFIQLCILYLFLGTLAFFSFSAFCVFYLFLTRRNIVTFCNICIIIIYRESVKYSVFLILLITFQLNNW